MRVLIYRFTDEEGSECGEILDRKKEFRTDQLGQEYVDKFNKIQSRLEKRTEVARMPTDAATRKQERLRERNVS